jgi:endoglucanase
VTQPPHGASRSRTTGRRLGLRAALSGLVVAGCVAAAAGLSPSAATAPQAGAAVVRSASPTAANPSNPLRGRTWGVYKGSGDQAWQPYVRAKGTNKKLLAKIALRPKAKWFGAWIKNSEIKAKVQKYIANSTGGNPNVLVQMTVFRMQPWEHAACKKLPTRAQQASYKQWIDRFAAGIGRAHVALILQPDGPFALCVPRGSKVPSQLIAYSAKKFSALPNTSVYIDGGASDWPKDNPAKSAQFLVPAGVKYARGFALNSTHYETTANEIAFGARVVSELARRGIPGKHFVVNTSSNGRGFEFALARGSHPDNAKVCTKPRETRCVTLGIPPTHDVTNARWKLSATNRARAAKHVDGYLWFGRPWLYMQADPFSMPRAIWLARTTPY